MNRKWRLYLDTSVFGGCFEPAQGWDADSQRVIGIIKEGRALLLYSEVLSLELSTAPEEVRALWENMPSGNKMPVLKSAEVVELAQAYLDAGVVGERWREDALHVAAATVARADAIVSWNFRHMVNLEKMKAYNKVNLAMGYGYISIVSPKEVNFDE